MACLRSNLLERDIETKQKRNFCTLLNANEIFLTLLYTFVCMCLLKSINVYFYIYVIYIYSSNFVL